MSDRKDEQGINEEITLMQRVSDQMERTADSLSVLESCVNKLDKKLDLHIQKMDYELKSIQKLDHQQNEILAEHSARSLALQKDNELREAALRMEIDKVKQEVKIAKVPQEWLQTTKTIAIWIGSVAAAVVGIAKILGMF